MDCNTNAFPNVNGNSLDSLAAMSKFMGGGMVWARGYRYVPGLREDDPGDLVLMYMERSTRWTWHGAPPSIFQKKGWLLVPVDFGSGGRKRTGAGELSERVSLAQFRARMSRTLDFVRTNERPYWQNVQLEHTSFLDSIAQDR
jgi:hypothetical protein